MSKTLVQFFGNQDGYRYKECGPTIVKCEPRNWWESFSESFHWQTQQAFADGVGIVVTVLLLAVAAMAVTHRFRQSKNYYAVYSILISGVAATTLSFALITYPHEKPFLIGIGVSLAVAAVFSAFKAIKDAR